MSEFHDKLRKIFEAEKELKQNWVRQNSDDPDTPTTISALRDWADAAMLAVRGEADELVKAIRYAGFGFSPDVLVVSTETVNARSGENPVTGKPWEAGEMMVLLSEYPEAREKGWVRESLTMVAMNRDEEYFFGSAEFVIKDGELTWGEEITFTDLDEASEVNAEIGGGLVNVVREAMTGPKMSAYIQEEIEKNPFSELFKQNSDEEKNESAQLAQDVSTIQHLHSEGLIHAAQLGADEGSIRAHMISELVPHMDQEGTE